MHTEGPGTGHYWGAADGGVHTGTLTAPSHKTTWAPELSSAPALVLPLLPYNGGCLPVLTLTAEKHVFIGQFFLQTKGFAPAGGSPQTTWEWTVTLRTLLHNPAISRLIINSTSSSPPSLQEE